MSRDNPSAAMAVAGGHMIEVDGPSFDQEVLIRSRRVPVVVDFWAEWCGPCRTLGPILERLAVEADGAWVLAKVDVDASPEVADGFGVQGIPAVRAFKDGRQIAEFTGALPEQQVRRWLEQLGPTPAELLFRKGIDAERAGDLEAAAKALRSALDHEPAHTEARRASARVSLALRTRGRDGGSAKSHDAVGAVLEAADLAASQGNLESAFERLIEVVRTGGTDDRERARARLLELLDILEVGDPRALAARRSLSLALF